MAADPSRIPPSPGFSAGSSKPRRKVRGPCCPLVGAPKTLPLALGLPNTSRPASRDAGKDGTSVFLPKPSSSRGARSRDVGWMEEEELRPQTAGSRSKGASPSSNPPGVYSTVLDIDAWVYRGLQIKELAKSLQPPSALLTAVVCDTASRLAPEPLPQHSLIKALMSHIESSIYCTNKVHGDQFTSTGVRVKAEDESSSTVVPQQYAGRVPFFVVVRRHEVRFNELRDRMGYLLKVRKRALNIRAMAPTLCIMSWIGIKQALLVWLFSFWHLYHTEAKRATRKKAEMLALTMVGDMIQPFLHWRIFVTDQHGATVQQTRHCFMLEKRMLAVEVKDLEEQREDVRSKLKLSNETSRRLQFRLDEEVRERRALGQRLEDARPEIVRSTLCSVLNMVFAGVLHISQLGRVAVRRNLGTKEFTVLLTFEEESVSKLASVPAESLLKRWLNYNLMQCKLVATEIFESVARARSEERDPSAGDAKLTEWSSRDAETFSDRCRTVRSLQRISNLDEDLRDGAVLSVLYASLASDSQGALNPAALWPLDERDQEARAAKLCGALRLVLPTRAAQCLLKPSDITRGNTPVISTILATLFLHFSNLPSSVPKNRVFDYVGASALSTASHEATALGGCSKGEGIDKNVHKILSHGAHTSSMTDHESAGATAVMPTPMPGLGGEDMTLKHVATSMERTACVCGYDNLQQLSLLLRSSMEMPADLMRLPPQDFVLRWLNYKLDKRDKDRINSLSDLKGGKDLMDLLRRIAPDVVALMPEARLLPEARRDTGSGATGGMQPGPEADQIRMQLCVEVGARCTSFDILTKEALIEGQADVIAAFLAGLFLSRPCLPVSPQTDLKKHIEHFEASIKQGTFQHWAEPNKDVGASFAKLCSWLQDNRHNFQAAMAAIEEARELHETVEQQLNTFLSDLLAQRARGTPCKIADEPEVHSAMRAQTLSMERLKLLVRRETDQVVGDDFNETLVTIEDLLRKHIGLFHEMFRDYAMHSNPSHHGHHGHHGHHHHHHHHGHDHLSRTGARFSRLGFDLKAAAKAVNDTAMLVDLQGLIRVYKDCHLCQTGLRPGDIEIIFHEVRADARQREQANEKNAKASEEADPLQKTLSGKIAPPSSPLAKKRGTVGESAVPNDFGLRLEDFIEALIVIAARASFKSSPMGLPDKIARLTERFLWPYACRPRENFFYQIANDVGVRVILVKYDAALRAVFGMYVTLSKKFMEESPNPSASEDKSYQSSPGKKGRKSKRGAKATAQSILRERSAAASSKALRFIHLGAFEVMLSNASLLKGRLDTVAIHRIFEGIQNEEEFPEQDSSDSSDEEVLDLYNSEDTGVGDVKDEDDSQNDDDDNRDGEVSDANSQPLCSFPEFTDALIAVVLYHDPNPFVTFALRFERFLREKLLKPLQKHWLANSPDGGLGKTLRELLGDRETHARQVSPLSKRRTSTTKFNTATMGGERFAGQKKERPNRIREGPNEAGQQGNRGSVV